MIETQCNDIVNKHKTKMKNVIESFIQYLKTIRAGKANIGIFETLKVEYYNEYLPINQLANLKIESPQVVIIEIWDLGAKENIKKAILSSPLGFNPVDQGKNLKIVFPPLTQESRAKIIKNVKTKLETFKPSIRNIRRDLNNELKNLKNSGSEDFFKKLDTQIQNFTNEYIKELETIFLKKQKELETL